MPIYLGSNQITATRLGTGLIQRLYLGGSRVDGAAWHPDVRDYQRRVLAAGGAVADSTLYALNVLATYFRENNLWHSELYLNPLCSDFAGLGVPFYAPTGIGNATLVGYTSGNYTLAGGLVGANGRRIETGVIPNTHFSSSNSCHMLTYFSANVNTSGQYGCENASSQNSFLVEPRNTNIFVAAYNNAATGTIDATNTSSLGLVGFTRTASNATAAYRRTVSIATSATAPSGRPSFQVMINCLNQAGTPNFYDTRTLRGFQFGGNGYTASQIAQLSYVWDLFNQHLRRAV